MCNYDYTSLKELRDRYATVRNHEEERIVAHALVAYLDEPDSHQFNNDFTVQHYAGEPAELLNLHPGIEERVGYLDGLLLKLDKPLEIYTVSELRELFFDLYKSKQIEILDKHENNDTTNNLSFVANELDVRHAQRDDYAALLNAVVATDVQRTALLEGINIMKSDRYQEENLVFNAVCREVRALFKSKELTKKRQGI